MSLRGRASALRFLTACLLLASIPFTTSIPHRSRALESRQSIFSSLALPKCALTCFINGLTKDGCKSETDFACHCEGGTVLSEAASCLSKECSNADREKAISQVQGACEAAGADPGDSGDDGDSSSRTGASSTAGSSTGPSSASSTPTDPSSSSGTPGPSPSTVPPSENPSNPTAAPAPSPSTFNPTGSTSSTSSASPSDEPPMPTDTPLALLPTDRQLSPGAKAGISVSVTVFASSILLFIFLYIRRLKRELKMAQAAAGVPESVWRAHIQTAAAPAPIGRRKSWRGKSRSSSRTPPGSPGSPGMRESGGDGVLKKKRGHVLSVVVERVEEEDTSSLERMVHEPVPGQKEGLVDPLELDGEHTGIVELPTSITPRTGRSIERGRERGSSLGESSRPSTADRGRGRW